MCICKKSDTITTMNNNNYQRCPWCGIRIEIIKRNCGIMRCDIYKTKNGKKYRQIPKHASLMKIINIMKNSSDIIGCCYPIRISKTGELSKGSWDD